MVLQSSSRRLPPHSPTSDFASHTATSCPDSAATSGRPFQLRGWVRQLDGGLVHRKEGMVLRSSWERLPTAGRRLRYLLGAIRLRGRVRELDGRLVSSKEGMVLLEQGQGVPPSGWRLRLMTRD